MFHSPVQLHSQAGLLCVATDAAVLGCEMPCVLAHIDNLSDV